MDIVRGITVVRKSDNPRRMAETVRSEPFRDDITMRERLIERRFNDDHRPIGTGASTRLSGFGENQP